MPEPPSLRLLVVTPAWNEEECIAGTIREIQAAVPQADVLVVDDGSADRTVDRARAAGAAVLVLPFNLGVGAAMRAGFKFALHHHYDAVIQVDADGQHDPSEIMDLVGQLSRPVGSDDDATGTADVVVGARFADEGGYRVTGPRRWAMTLLAKVLTRMARTRLTDTTSGFRAANRRAISLYARHYPAEFLGDTIESLVIAIRAGLTVTQVPVHMRPRAGGKPSKSPTGAAVYLFRAALILLLARIRRWPTMVMLDPDHPVPVR
ncbi:MAG: glycosyltransferase family 2 protein [Geodermatophilaceae bacterium]|nr:glycosyltransferase family 2 protein [Geodermatophilaceae bacterium]